MTEWWTYRLSDFLMFAPRTYYRMIELANTELWPAHVLTLTIGAVIFVLLAVPSRFRASLACALLALPWWWVGWAFLWQRYASINWAAGGFAIGFALQGASLLALAVCDGGQRVAPRSALARRVGLGLWLVALVLHPALALLLGRPWQQAEWFGIAPDPTVLATLGLLLLMAPAVSGGRARAARVLVGLSWCVPLGWCVVSGLTLWAMASPEAWLMPTAAALALFAAWRG